MEIPRPAAVAWTDGSHSRRPALSLDDRIYCFRVPLRLAGFRPDTASLQLRPAACPSSRRLAPVPACLLSRIQIKFSLRRNSYDTERIFGDVMIKHSFWLWRRQGVHR